MERVEPQAASTHIAQQPPVGRDFKQNPSGQIGTPADPYHLALVTMSVMDKYSRMASMRF
jgi:hypothetical protein